jgi:toxin ParE1/3/4
MNRAVLWSRDALDDLKQQLVYISTDDPDAARNIIAHIRRTGDQLSDFATGHPGRVSGTYEKSVPRLPYIIAYALAMHQGREIVAILRVIHTSRDWEAESWPT